MIGPRWRCAFAPWVFLLSPWAAVQANDELHLGDDVEVLAPHKAGTKLGETHVDFIDDSDNVSIYRVQGDYDRGLSAPRFEVARSFYEAHPDEFDFLIAFTGFEFPTENALAFYNPVRNEVVGVGLEQFDHSAEYGSAGRLQGYIDMAALSRYDFNTRSQGFRSPLNTLSHEIMHRWSVRLRYADAGGALRPDLIGREGAHWSLLASTDASIMYGARWLETGPGRWSIIEAHQRLGEWDLYLAGLADISEMSAISLIRSGDVAPGDLPRVGLNVQGTSETIAPTQILAAEGARVPAASDSQRVFDAAIILLLRPDQTADPRDLARLERFRVAFEQYFQSITQGRATIRLHLRGVSSARVAAPAALIGSEVSPRPQPTHAAVQWLRSRQLGDGSWADRPGSAARDTAAALATLVEFDAGLPEVAQARQWLAVRTARNLDERAWLQMARPEQTVAGAAEANPDGGFGLLARWRSSPVDAIRALAASSLAHQRDETAIAHLASFVRLQQNADGSIGPTHRGAGRVAVSTATADQLMRREDPADRAAGGRVRDWLQARLAARPLGEGLFSLAEVAELTQRAGSLELPAATRAALTGHLLARQGEDGDWQGSVYTTATAALALMRESRPNLVPLAVMAEPGTAVRGEAVRLRVRVGNPAGQPAAASSLQWYDAAPQAGGQPVTPAIPVRAMLAGDEVVTDAWIETAAMTGARELFAVVDVAGEVEETREDDNIASLILGISPPPEGIDLGVDARDMDFEPDSFHRVPSTVRLSGRVRNYGTTAAMGVHVRAVHVQASGESVLAETSVDVGAAAQGSFELDLPIALPQAHRVRVVVDPDNAVSEAREINNAVELSLPFADAVDFELMGETLAFVATPALGDDTRVRVSIANRGTRDTPLSVVVLERQIGDGWTRIAESDVGIPAGQEVQRELVWRPQQEGLQNLRLRVDPDAAVAETDEDNNLLAFTQQVIRNDAPSLQIVPDSITLLTTPVRQGQPLQLGVVVRNVGASASAGFNVALYLGDPRAAGVRVGVTRVETGLASQSESPVQIEVAEFPEHGDVSLFVHADSSNEIVEVNEDDNYGIREVTALGLPDLAVTLGAFTLTPAAPVVGAPVTAQVEVSNLGEQPSVAVRVGLSELATGARGEVTPALTVPALAPGSSHVVSWSWTFGLVEGVQALSVEVDPDNQLRERDEGNNEATRLLDTQSGDFFVNEPYFSPNGDGVKDQVRAVFSRGAGIGRVSVIDHAGRERRSLDALDDTGAGAVGVIWDGRDQAGRVLNDGRYGLLALGGNGEAQGPVYVTLDTDRPMALEAVNSENGVHRTLPVSANPWIELPQGSPGEDYLYAVGHDSNPLNQFKRGVVRTHALLGGAEPVLTARWLDRYVQDSGLISIEPVQVDFLADGRLLIAMHEFGGGNRTLLFAMGANEVDKPVFVSAISTRVVDPLLERIDAQRVLVGDRDRAQLWVLDVPAGSATALRERGAPYLALLPTGVLTGEGGYYGQLAFVPFDPSQSIQSLPGAEYGNQLRVSFLQGTHWYLDHWQSSCDSGGGGESKGRKGHDDGSGLLEAAYVVDARNGERRLLHSILNRNPEVQCSDEKAYADARNGDITHNGLRTFWLEQQRVAVVVDHHGGQVLQFDAEGRSLGRIELPALLRRGDYVARAGETPVLVHEVNPSESLRLHSSCPVSAHAPWLELARSELGFEHRSFDPDANSLYLTTGESVFGRDGNGTSHRCDGAVDYLRVGHDQEALRLGGSSGWPLEDAADSQVYPPIQAEGARAVPPPEWPRFIHGNGTRLRHDGRVQIPHQGRLTASWSYAAEMIGASPDETRLQLGHPGAEEERTVALFSTLERLSAVLTASSDRRAIRLAGIATDRNFDHFQIDWAHASASDSWNALLPATSEAVRFDDFLTWAPPQAGAYLFRLRVVDRAGNQRDRFATAEVAFGAPIANVRQNHRAISPNGDGVQDRLDLSLLVLRPTEQRFEVRDFAGRVVRREDRVFGVAELGVQAWAWDGRDDQGVLAPEGRYRVELSSGFVLRVNLDVTAPVVEANLTLPWDHYDRLDLNLRDGEAPLEGLGPIIDYRVTDVFAGQPATPQRRALESAALDRSEWMELQPAHLLQHEDGLLQAALSSSQYVGHRFRIVAIDAAGNRAQVEAGASMPALLLLHADKLRAELPGIQARPYGRTDDIPHYSVGNPTSGRLNGTPIQIGTQVPLFALDLAGEVAALAVDELESASGGGMPTWVTRNVAVPTPADAGPLPHMAGHLRVVPVDLSARNPGDEVALRVRARYADNTERVSNALRFTMGGLELLCPPLSPSFRTRSYLEPTASDFVMEVGDQARRVLERVPSDNRAESLDGSAPLLEGDANFPAPNAAEIRVRHGLPAETLLLYRATALDRHGQAVASKWIPCSDGPAGETDSSRLRVMPVFSAQCDALPSGLVHVESLDAAFQAEHRLVVRSPFLSQPFIQPIELDSAVPRITELDVSAWPEAEFAAVLERRSTPESTWVPVVQSAFVVDHRVPVAEIQTPVDGDRICANNPTQHQAAILVRDARRVGWQLESRKLQAGAPFEQFACGGYADADGTCESQDFETGEVRAITARAPLELIETLQDEQGDEMVELRLRASDWSGGQVCDTVQVAIDGAVRLEERAAPTPTPPRGAYWPLIAPASSGVYREARWSLLARERTAVMVTLHRAQRTASFRRAEIVGDAIATLGTTPSVFGQHDVAWDGRIGGQLGEDGLYGVRFHAVDDCGNIIDLDRIVELDSTPPEIELTAPVQGAQLRAVTVPISGRVDDAHLDRYSVSISQTSAEGPWLGIADGTRPVRVPEVLAQWPTAGAQGPVWIRMSAHDAVGNVAQLVRSIELLPRAAVLQEALLEPPLFSPNADGRLDEAVLRLALRRAARLQVRVLDAQGGLVRTLASDLDAPVGSLFLTWDGRNDIGAVAADATYSIELRAVDAAAPESVDTQVLDIVLDTVAPTLSAVKPEATFANCETGVEFSVDDPHFSEVESTLVHQGVTVVAHEAAVGGYHLVAHLFGMTEGEYSYAIQARDAAGNSTESSREFALDCTAATARLDVLDGAVVPRVDGHVVEVRGAATDANLLRYQLTIASAATPEQRTTVAEATTPVESGELFRWQPTQPDGEYQLRLQVEDRAGNLVQDEHRIRIDGTPPTADIGYPSDGAAVKRSLYVSGRASDANFQQYRLEFATPQQATREEWSTVFLGEQPVNQSTLGNLEIVHEGEVDVRLVVTDKAGLSSTDRIRVRVDGQPPPALSLSGSVEQRRDVRLAWEGPEIPDLGAVRILRNGVDIERHTLPARSYVDRDAPEGELSYVVIAVDQAGNAGDPSNAVVLNVDRTPPELALYAPNSGERIRANYVISGAAHSDDFSEWELAVVSAQGDIEVLRRSPTPITGGPLHTWDTRTLASESAVRLRLIARDLSGNESSLDVPVSVDNEPPAAPTGLVAVDAGALVQVNWDANLEPDLLGYLLYRGGELVGYGGVLPADLRPLAIATNAHTDAVAPDGELAYRVYAIDRAGNISPASAPAQLVRDAGPPELEIIRPQAGQAFEEAIEVVAQSPDRDIAQVAFSFRQSGTAEWTALGAPATELPWRNTFEPEALSYGEYELRAVATDRGGLSDPEPPIVTVRYADLTPPLAPTQLRARADGFDVRLAWALGTDTDLAGYRVQRQAATGAWESLEPAMGLVAEFVDIGRPLGEHRYRVVAIDSSDNASAPSALDSAHVFELNLEQPFTPVAQATNTLQGVAGERGGRLEYQIVSGSQSASGQGATIAAHAAFSLPELPLFVGGNEVSVRLRDEFDNVSVPSTVHVQRGEVPLPPTDVAGTLIANNVALTWQASVSEDVVGYRVHRNGRVLGLDTRVAQTIRAQSANGEAPALVDQDVGTAWMIEAPAASPILSYPGHLTLSWDQPALVSGLRLHFADAQRSVSDYRVSMLDPVAGWITLGERSGRGAAEELFLLDTPYPTRSIRIELQRAQAPGATVSVLEIEPLQRQLVAATTYEDTVTDGRHAYAVTAVSALGFESPLSEPWTVEVGDAIAPPAPTLTGSIQAGAPTLEWTESGAADLSGYVIYRDGARIAQLPAALPRTYADLGLGNGRYAYTVAARDQHFNESPRSNEVTLDLASQGPGAPTIVSVQQPGEGLALRISWTPGPGAPPASYRLFVSSAQNDPASPYALLLAVPGIEYLHQGLERGRPYWYRVQALDANGNAGELSAPASGEARDVVAPQTPRLYWPTVPGVPIIWTQPTYEVCGVTSPGANVLLARNGAGLSEVRANAESPPRRLPFAVQGLNVLLAPEGDAVFLPGLAGESDPGWFNTEDGTRAETVSRSSYPVSLARYSGDGQRVFALSADGLWLYRFARDVYDGFSPYVGDLGTVRDFASNRSGDNLLLLIEHVDLSVHLYRWNNSSGFQSITIPAGRSPARGSLAWANGTQAVFADTDGRVYRYSLGAAVPVAIGEGATFAGPLPAPREAAWIAVDRATARVLRFDADGQPPRVLLDDGRLPLAVTWVANGAELALRFEDRLEFRDATTGVLLRASLQDALDPTPVYRLQWIRSGRLLLTSSAPDWIPEMTEVPGAFCVSGIVALSGANVVEAIAENASGLLSLASDPIEIDHPLGTPDLVVDEHDLRFFPVGAQLNEQRIVYIEVRNEGDRYALSETGAYLRATLRLPDGSERVIERDGRFELSSVTSMTVALDLGRLSQLGEYRLHVAVDPDYRIVESDEANNAVSVSWQVGSTTVPELSLVTERTVYAPGSRVDGAFTVFNPGPTFAGTVTIEARDASNAPMGEIGRLEIPALAYGQTRSEEWSWVLPPGLFDGEYQILARLRDNRGALIAERSVLIELESEVDLALLLQPQSTRAVIGPSLPVQIGVDYLGGNRVLDNGTLRLSARDASGDERVLWTGTSGVLLSGYSVRRSIDWPVAMQSLGVHTLRLDFASGEVARSTTREVEFVADASMSSIRGSLTLAPAPQLILGEASWTLQVVVENPAAALLAGTQLRVRVTAEGEATPRLEQTWSTDLAAGVRVTQSLGLAELATTPSGFVARLEARLAGDAADAWRPLATLGFAAVDGEAPEISLITPDALTPRRSPTPIAVRIFDRHTRVERASYRVDGGEWRALSAGGIDGYEGLMHGLSDGAHVLALRARDAWSNEAVSESHQFVVDTTPPSIVVGAVSDGDRRNVAVIPTISIVDAHPDGYSAWLDDAPYVAGTAIDGEGAHRLQVISIDLAGNRSDRTLSFTLDFTPPSLAIVSPADGATTTLDAIVIRVASEAGAEVEIDVGGYHAEAVANSNGEVMFAAVPLLIGANRIEARANDAAQNASAPAVIQVTRQVASGELSGQLLAPAEFPRGQELPVQLRIENGTATDYPMLSLRLAAFAAGGSELYSQSLQANVPAGSTVTLVQSLDTQAWPWGPTALVLESDLGAGYRTLDSFTVTVSDAQPPQIVVIAPGSNSVQPRAVALELTAADDRGVVAADYRVDDGVWSTLSQDGQAASRYLGQIEPPDGAHAVRFRARDAAGNVAMSSDIAFVVDGTPPQIAVSGVADGEAYAQPVSPVVEILDANPGALTLLLDDAPFSPGTEITASGLHVLLARATDAAGNQSERTLRFTIDREPPNVTFVQPRDGSIVVTDRVLVVGETEPGAEVGLSLGEFAATVSASAQGVFSVSDVPLVEGENVLIARATDVVGNEGATSSLRVFRSAAGPTGIHGTLTARPPLVPMGGTFALDIEVIERAGNARAAMPLRVELRSASSSTVLWVRDRTIALAAGQTYAASEAVESRDLSQGDFIATLRTQHEGTWYELASVSLEVVDSAAPVVTLLAPAMHSVHREDVESLVGVTDDGTIDAVQIRADGSEWQPMTAVGGGEWRHALMLPREGELIIEARARDARGNTSVPVSVPVRSDLSPPVILVEGVTDGQHSRAAVTPRIVVEDASEVDVGTTLDGAGYVSGTLVAEEGEHMLVVEAEDVVGHRSERRVTFVVDSTPPPLTIIQPLDGALVSSPSIDVMGRTEPGAQVRLESDGAVRDVQADGEGTFVATAFPLHNGDNLLRARASDAAGNVGEWVQLSVLRTCGTVDLACSIFANGFESSPGDGFDRKDAVDASLKGGSVIAAPALIPALRPGTLLVAMLLLLGAGLYAYSRTRAK